MSKHVTDETALYGSEAADIYAAFRAMPTSTSVADDFNAMRAVQQAVGGRNGVRVVDLGCGPGLRTREIAELAGVTTVLGIDHSHEQLGLAHAEPVPGTCRFAFGDLVALGQGRRGWAGGAVEIEDLLGSFDVAFMGFVTSHAATQAELDAMLRAAAAFLRPGGRLVVIDAHPRLDTAPFPPCDQYGVGKTVLAPAGHGGVIPAFTPIRITFITPKGALTVEDYFHDVASWSAAAAAAGLRGLVVEDFSAPPTGEPGFWDAYITPDHPAGCSQAAVIRAVKPDRR